MGIPYDVSGSSARTKDESGPKGELLTETQVQWRVEARQKSSEASEWLYKRGLSDETCDKYLLGLEPFARPRLVIPLFRDGVLVNVKRRFLDTGDPNEKYKAVSGRPHVLYPRVLPTTRKLVVCEGEFDALVARQNGLAAVTGTAGMYTWRDEWTEQLRGCQRVDIVFDAGPGPYAEARKLVKRLQDGGIQDAFAVRLARAGLEPGEDLTDWFAKYKRTRRDLRRLIDKQRGGQQ